VCIYLVDLCSVCHWIANVFAFLCFTSHNKDIMEFGLGGDEAHLYISSLIFFLQCC